MSELQKVDLVFSSFFSYFYFLFDLFPIILFLELGLGLGLEWQDHAVTQQVTPDDRVTKPHDTGEEGRRFWKNDIIQCEKHMTDLKAYTWLFRVG